MTEEQKTSYKDMVANEAEVLQPGKYPKNRIVVMPGANRFSTTDKNTEPLSSRTSVYAPA